MDTQASGRRKSKSKKERKGSQKSKTPKKRKTSDGPTCSMFLAELTRKLATKKKEEEESPNNVVQKIIESLTNALPVVFSKKSILSKKDSPVAIEKLQEFAPELLPNDTVEIHQVAPDDFIYDDPRTSKPHKMPRMPIVSSDIMKPPVIEKREPVQTADAAVNTGGDLDVASEIAKHVSTLRKISLIAEEFHQKTAKNLKEIVDSVQADLIKKLDEIKAEQRDKEAQRNIEQDEASNASREKRE